MKRRRSLSTSNPRRQRPRRPAVLQFMGLLPEMHGEIAARLYSVSDRAALARTCVTMHSLVKLPKLPLDWRYAWEKLKATATVEQIQSASMALLELVAFGVPKWAGVFRHGQCYYVAAGEFGNCMGWQWRDDNLCHYFNLEWYVDSQRWEVHAIALGVESHAAITLVAIPPTVITTWRDFIATPRHRPRYLPTPLASEFDHD